MPKLCKKVIKPSLHNEFTKIVTVETSFSDYFLAQQKNVSLALALALDMRTPEVPHTICLPYCNGVFHIHVTEITSTVDDHNKFSVKTK